MATLNDLRAEHTDYIIYRRVLEKFIQLSSSLVVGFFCPDNLTATSGRDHILI